MLDQLKFVQGAVAKKDFLPELTHFAIDGGRVRGYNGMLALCTPIPFDIECKPKADALVRAISKCSETVQLSLTPTGKLSIKSGAFRALIDCVPAERETPHVEPDGDVLPIQGEALLAALKAVNPFIADDASRPWSNGVLLSGTSAFATNNVTAVEYWVGDAFPRVVNLPRACVKEMLRIDEAPVSAQFGVSSVTFHYSGERWIRTHLLEADWPDLAAIIDGPSDCYPIDEELFAALDTLRPFLDKMGRVYMGEGKLTTHADPAEGAVYELPSAQHAGLYRLEILQLLQGTCQRIDWSAYPERCRFFGDRLRGVLIGMHKK